MQAKLNARNGLITVVLYMVGSIVAGVIAALFLGGVETSEDAVYINTVVDGGMYGTIIVTFGLIFVCFRIFPDSLRDIFFEHKSFNLSKLYYTFPIIHFALIVFALFFVNYSTYTVEIILRVIILSFAIGINEEIVTRGILLVGFRNRNMPEWLVWLLTTSIFAILHSVNLLAGGNITVFLVTLSAGTIYYITRRVFKNLFAPIVLHALNDVAFFLLPGSYVISQGLPDRVLDIQFGSFLVILLLNIVFLIVYRFR